MRDLRKRHHCQVGQWIVVFTAKPPPNVQRNMALFNIMIKRIPIFIALTAGCVASDRRSPARNRACE
ncbi:hypothetical protein DLM46_35490 [Paraburkholderia lacunae]|uniref:Uncharacterized protein n=1 Tax=Paraburkholderia lacunae TaxID=2211104 RepID=A0A370MXN9_9BURK|nr:hypothetical protein DLM46_35490 [Paraburkholderia lacunae]